ncbi:MAG TPA: hypothetical protein VGG16_13865 [Streptosporangiaceae bacterium]
MEARAGRYIAGLCASALGLCAGGWLVLTPFAFGYRGRGREAVTALATGGGLIVISSLMLLCWALAWRRRLRVDGVLAPRRSRAAQRKAERSAKRQARAERLVRVSRQHELESAPDPAQVLTDLRALLTPLLSAAEESVSIVPAREPAPTPAETVAAETAPAETGPASVEMVAITETSRGEVSRPEVNREVQAPGHLRGARSASFFALPKQADAESEFDAEPIPADSLMRGAELLMVGTGEEESW